MENKIWLSEKSWIVVVPNVFDVSEEEFQELLEAHPTTYNQIKLYGKELDIPRFERLYGTRNYRYSGIMREAHPDMPRLAKRCLEWVQEHDGPAEKWQGLLCNWYMHGNHRIGKHSDAEGDLTPGEPIYSFSMGGSRTFRLCAKKTAKNVHIPKKDIETEHGMLIVMGGDCQKEFTHEVPKSATKHTPRCNITIRSFAPHAVVTSLASSSEENQEQEEMVTKRAKVEPQAEFESGSGSKTETPQ
jgi:alkylated DNA repair dioxygenase AlkB